MPHPFVSRLFARLLPGRSPGLYRLFKFYVNRYEGNNLDDPATNGEIRLLSEIVPHCQLVFDVGANTGEWAGTVLRLNPTVQIHCFEPSQKTYAQLAARDWPPNVVCNNLGLGAKRRTAQLFVMAEGSGLNSIFQRQGLEAGWGLSPPTQTEKIELETLDHYCDASGLRDRQVDLCKLDVEGYELEVLKGSLQMLESHRIRRIQFEYGGCNIDARVFLKDLFDFFQPFGYRLHKILPDGLRFVERYDQRLENFQYQNWLATLE